VGEDCHRTRRLAGTAGPYTPAAFVVLHDLRLLKRKAVDTDSQTGQGGDAASGLTAPAVARPCGGGALANTLL